MKYLALVAVVALAGCKSEVDAAKERYDIVSANSMSDGAKCQAAREVAAAYLKDGNAGMYEAWDMRVRLDCDYPAL